ncbi:MAG: aldehyde dehydrogenase family protein, partial [Clostridia bacterium]|nr:aldehyde dehydrogenase family protein [Clostridia bacterium]
MTTLEQMGQNAKQAARFLLTAGELKNKALLEIADALIANADEIVKANDIDIQIARENNTRESLIDRLTLTKARIEGMADGVRQVAALADPTGVVLSGSTRPNGLRIEKVRVPMGVIGIIYEARPNVTSDAAALCLKSGNAVILRGGKEAINSNKRIADIMRNAIEKAGLPKDCIALVEDTSRASSVALMQLSEYLDV